MHNCIYIYTIHDLYAVYNVFTYIIISCFLFNRSVFTTRLGYGSPHGSRPLHREILERNARLGAVGCPMAEEISNTGDVCFCWSSKVVFSC